MGVSDASWEEEVNLTEEWVCRGGAEGITLINITLILLLWRRILPFTLEKDSTVPPLSYYSFVKFCSRGIF